jgi:aconitate hydratase 2/2-methylisocitrate dehydratase
VVASLGRIPTHEEYLQKVAGIEPMSDEIYRYLNFDQIAEYSEINA